MHLLNLIKIVRLFADSQERVSGSVIFVTAIVVGLIVCLLAIYIQIDYRRHRRPLKEIDPNVHYSHIHHIQVVVIPMAKFRTSSFFDRFFHRNI